MCAGVNGAKACINRRRHANFCAVFSLVVVVVVVPGVRGAAFLWTKQNSKSSWEGLDSLRAVHGFLFQHQMRLCPHAASVDPFVLEFQEGRRLFLCNVMCCIFPAATTAITR